jgi:heat shock protein HslJ
MSDDVVREKVRLYAAEVTPVQLPAFGGVAVRRRRRRVRQVLAATSTVVVVVLVVVFAALASHTSASRTAAPNGSLASQLVGPTWTLQSVTNAGEVWRVPKDKHWAVTFTATTYQGDDSCNGTFGPVTFGTSTVTLGQGSSTLVGCIGADAQRLQDLFRSFESGPAEAVVSGDTLTLTIGGQVLTLTPPAESLQSRLAGRSWRLTAITAGPNTSSTPITAGWRLHLTPTAYDGTDGCRGQAGTVTYTSDSLTLSSTAAHTTQLCADPQGSQRAFQALLKGPVTASVYGETLSLTVPSVGVLTLTSTPTPIASPADTAGAALESWLTANTWLLHSITSGGVSWNDPGSSIEQRQAALVFGPHGYMSNADCNDHSGAVSYAGGKLIMRAIMQTAMACPAADVVQKKSAQVADALFRGPVTYTHQGNSLVLSSSETSIKFTAGPKLKTPLGVDLPPASAPPPSAFPATSLESSLVGPSWKLESLVSGSVTWRPKAGSTAALTMTGTSYQASDGCDSQGSDLSFDRTGEVLTFGGTIASMGECALAATGPPAGTFAPPEYFEALKGTVHASFEGATLTLTSDGTVLTLSRESTTPTSSAPTATLQDQLIGPKWALTSITGGGQTWQAPDGVRFDLTFSATGYGGDDGCNYRGGAAAYAAGTVRLSQGSTTQVECLGPDTDRMHSAFDKLLSGPVTASVTDGTWRSPLPMR